MSSGDCVMCCLLETGTGGSNLRKLEGGGNLEFSNLTPFYWDSSENHQFGGQKSKLSKNNFRGEFPPLAFRAFWPLLSWPTSPQESGDGMGYTPPPGAGPLGGTPQIFPLIFCTFLCDSGTPILLSAKTLKKVLRKICAKSAQKI